jgi:hypothetical protein
MNNTTTSRFVVKVDSYGNDSYLNSKKYIIASGDSAVDESSLQYLEFASYVKKILAAKGYAETNDWDDADLMIFFKYGISDPETFQQTYAVPTWGQTGVSSTTTKGNVYVNPYGNNIDYNETTTSSPTYGITGSRNVTRTYTKYFRYITLTAYDLNVYKTDEKEKIAWNTILTSSGSSDDLRRVIPYMVVVGSSYFGKSSGEKKSHEIFGDDERVKQLKGISEAQ